MGIRYYAYAFDSQLTEQALTDPHSILSDDPLADAWGLEPHAAVSYTTFEQSVPERDMLYLDKAWGLLQDITGQGRPDGQPRPAFAMFEGQVTMHGYGWEPWVRTLTPEGVAKVSRDLDLITDAEAEALLRRGRHSWRNLDDDVSYALTYLAKARTWAAHLVADGRGLVYTIG